MSDNRQKNFIPRQKLKRSKKTKQWGKECVEGFVSQSSFMQNSKSDLLRFYEAYNGELAEKDYNYVTNPYNSQAGKKRNFPAKLRNYNIIKPVIDLLLGEKTQRPSNYQVTVTNGDAVSRLEEEKQKRIVESLQQMFINELNEQGVETGVDSQEVDTPEQVAKYMETTYQDSRAIVGQQVLNYLRDYLDLPDKLQSAFFDWLVSGYVYSYKGVCMDDVEYEVVSPLDLDYSKSPGLEFIEDGDWVVRRELMSSNAVLDQFYDLLSDKEVSQVESPHRNRSGSFSIPFLQRVEENFGDDERFVEVMHVCWKSFKQVGVLTYTDEFGVSQEIMVDDSYTVDKEAGEEIEKFWINEVWEGYRIDGDIYLGMEPIEAQRNGMSNISKCKLPYNGRAYSNRHAENVSIVSMGMPYQILYNVFHYRMELTIAKNKDKIALIEMNTIPKRHGWDEEKFMYYADAMGFAFIDSTAEGKNNERVSFNQYQVLDMSLGQYIAAQMELLNAIKQEWEELLGISRQRKGQVTASDGAGTTNTAIAQSTAMTEEIFRKFEKFEQKEMQGLLDISKSAFRDGKKIQYIADDYRNAWLDIEGSQYAESEFGIFAKNASKENQKLETMRQLTMSMAQNGVGAGTIAEILDADNFSRIKQLANKAEAKQEELQQQQNEAAQQLEQSKAQAKMQEEQMKQEFEAQENQLDRENKIQVATINAVSKDSDHDNDGKTDAA
jgi:hypothetical protein